MEETSNFPGKQSIFWRNQNFHQQLVGDVAGSSCWLRFWIAQMKYCWLLVSKGLSGLLLLQSRFSDFVLIRFQLLFPFHVTVINRIRLECILSSLLQIKNLKKVF
jgi:hypothetical protein